MRVTVDAARCQGHTLCNMNAPEVFILSDEDGHAQAITGDVPEHWQEATRLAAIGCPERAVRLLEEDAQ
jgi:ferredoxin